MKYFALVSRAFTEQCATSFIPLGDFVERETAIRRASEMLGAMITIHSVYDEPTMQLLISSAQTALEM